MVWFALVSCFACTLAWFDLSVDWSVRFGFFGFDLIIGMVWFLLVWLGLIGLVVFVRFNWVGWFLFGLVW